MVRRLSVVHNSQTSPTAICGASLGGGTKACLRHLDHMTKMAAKPIYGKNPSKILFSGTSGQIFTKLGKYHLGLLPS